MHAKLILSTLLTLLFSSEILAQDNVFLSRDYWKTNPTVEQVKKAISEGNNPSELNTYAFDAIVYALLEKTNDDTIKYLLTLEGNEVNKRTHDSRTYIFWAAYKGNTNIMKHLFRKGAVINIRDSHGNTPVTFAAATGQKKTEVYNLFETNGAILNKEINEEGVNVLFLVAPYLDNEKELNYFISKGFNLKDKDPIGNTIFNHAARKGNLSFLKLLISKGVNPKITNTKGGNAILYASKGLRNSQNTLETYQFLEGLGIPVNVIGDRGCNPLHAIAYRSDDLKLFTYFIKKGVSVTLQDNAGNSPFINAANGNTLKVVQFLSQHVKDFNIKNENGRSALTSAVNRNDTEVVTFLLEKGADVKTKDNDGNTLGYYLLNTFKAEDTAIFDAKLKVLKAHGLVMNTLQNGGNTLLHIATERNNLALIKRVITFGIDINTKNKEGYTALHIAAMKAENDAILKYLLNNGANKTIRTEFNETVLDLASENELLQKQNIKLNFLQ